MALKTFVKVSGINNLSDARYCAGMEVNQLGFEVEEGSDNYIDPQTFKEIKGWVSGVEFVGEISNPNASFSDILEQYELDAIQVENLAQIEDALGNDTEVIFKCSDLETAQKAAQTYGARLAYILIEGFDASDELFALAETTAIVLASDFNEESVLELTETSLKGIAIKGGNEIRPGFKDFDEMAEILEALEIDDLA